ncbi:MAG: Crp/Fnr family transcriptional regulator [Pseudobdellovibrionaceae bacterium]
MSGGTKKVEKDHYLFREGDPPDAMYVIKSGKFAVVKTKASSEIVLAEIGPGQMVGEMAFFDGKPRSASVKAVKESEVIALPYKSLHAQFAQFPEWSKAIMRTVNESLRNANQKIKQLEKIDQEGELFPPHTITKLVSILNLVATKYGKHSEEDKGLVLPGGILRNYTIQIFQEPTHKMQKLMNSLMEQGLMKVEDIGEGRQKLVLFNPELLYVFVEWFNDWLFKQEKDRITVKEEHLKTLRGVMHFCKKSTPDEKGLVKLQLTELQNDSMRDLGYLIKVEDTMPLVELKLIGDHIMEESGVYSMVHIAELEKVVPFWSIIYTLRKIAR